MSTIAFTGGYVCVDPTSEPVRDGVVVIAGGVISAAGSRDAIDIPDDAQIVDCSDCTVTAGFWNSHVHFTERKWRDAANIPAAELQEQLRAFTRYGFTSLFDLSSHFSNTAELRTRIGAHDVAGPRIFTTGTGIVPPGVSPPDLVSSMMGWMSVQLPEIATPDDAANAARTLIESGVDGIKLFASGPPSVPGAAMSEDTMRAAVGIAHAARKPVFVHPNTVDDVGRAVRAGVDVIAHTVPRSASPHDDIVAAAAGETALIPTLMLWKHVMRHDRLSLQQRFIDTAIEQLAAFRASGGTVLFGTDHGAVDADPSDEYEFMARAGMTFRDILASLTTAPAQRFAQKTAALALGNAADLVVLRGAPSDGPRIFSNVRLTVCGGRIVYSDNTDA